MNIPEKMLAWPLWGAGMEKLGKNNAPCLMDTPSISEDELLVRIDAIGLCFSDVKLIWAGEKHPRVISPDLSREPIIPGHEAVMTIVKVGKKLSDQFEIGRRFIIQADIYVNGKGFAYGYAINGGMAQYSRIDQRILNGDEGCYLLPLKDSTPYGIAALIEPWTCVIASYRIKNRKAPLKGGKVLIATENDDETLYEPGKLLTDAAPSEISVLGLNQPAFDALISRFPGRELQKLYDIPNDDAFDDIFLCNIKDRKKAEKLAKTGKRNAVISFIGDYPDKEWSFDIGNIHYKAWFYQGCLSINLSDAYNRNVRSKLKKNGTCWLVGGAGAMGQMHTRLAVESKDTPSRILVTDMDNFRIKNLEKLLKNKTKKREIEFKTLNPSDYPSPDAFEKDVAEFASVSGGFDDIVMLVPVIPVINNAVRFLKEDGLMNIFAGIPAGKEGFLNVGRICREGLRFIGSSGSSMADLRHTLKLVEDNKLSPVATLAAIGGMNELKKGLEAVANGKFPGKIVIFPQCKTVPLTPIEDIGKIIPGIESTLSGEGFYTQKTEEKLLSNFAKV